MRQVELPTFVTSDNFDLAILRGDGIPDLHFRCHDCGAYGTDWAGRCPQCGSENVEDLYGDDEG